MFTRCKTAHANITVSSGTRLDELWRRGVALLIRLQVIADALPVIECAVFFPIQRRLLGQTPMFFNVIFRRG